jgi:hypothetical protein
VTLSLRDLLPPFGPSDPPAGLEPAHAFYFHPIDLKPEPEKIFESVRVQIFGEPV